MKKFKKAQEQGTYRAHVYVLFNQKLAPSMAQEASSAIFQDLVKRNHELGRMVEELPRDAMMDMQHDCTAQEFPMKEFEKGAAEVLGQWAAGKLSPNSKHPMPFVHASSMQVVDPDGTRTKTDFAIAVVMV